MPGLYKMKPRHVDEADICYRKLAFCCYENLSQMLFTD